MRFYLLIIILFILQSCSTWIAADWGPIPYMIVSIIAIMIWISLGNKRAHVPRSYIIMFICLCGCLLILNRLKIFGTIGYGIMVFAMSTPFFLRTKEQTKLLIKINNILGILVIVSILFHVLKILGFLPSVPIMKRGGYLYQNYFVYLYGIEYEYRFCGFCYEPGFFAILLSALLLVNGYDFKKRQTIIYFIALILTFCLGGYIITLICWYLYYT